MPRSKVQMSGGRLVAVRDGSATSRYPGPFIVRSTTPGALVRYDGKRYRGEIMLLPTDTGMLIVNRLAVESYLRGVVPLEIGDRKPGEEAAVQAQAVAARSYSYVHMSEARARAFDMYGTVQDQVYGGADAEKPIADDAIVATRDMVLQVRRQNHQYSVPLDMRWQHGRGAGGLVEGAQPALSAARERPHSRNEQLLL